MKYELIQSKEKSMVVLDIKLDNLYAFKNFHMNLSYPKKIVGSCINNEHLKDRSNFRYKKVNIILGANASGKTTLGRTLMKAFNFIDKKNYEIITGIIGNTSQSASFTLDLASGQNVLYRVKCSISPCNNGKYSSDNIALEIRSENIRLTDSYESCIKRIEEQQYSPNVNYLEELEKIEELDWMFEYPEDTARMLRFPEDDPKFLGVLENVLKALDPSIQIVEKSNEVENTYIVRLMDKSIILQNGEPFTTNVLSSGTKAGVEVARVLSSLIQKRNTFYYCDEKFPYVHTDIEKAILSLMIESIQDNAQIFFTTHNSDILDMNLPKHSFAFLRKDKTNTETPISCVDASVFLKRSTDSLRNAVENDLFCTSPSVDLLYDISEM